MDIRATLLAAFIALSGPPLAVAADCLPVTASDTGSIGTVIVQPPLDTIGPGFSSAGDITGGRGPNPNAKALRQIAIYAAIGNKDGEAMLSAELRQLGVTREEIRRAIDRIPVHQSQEPIEPVQTGQLHTAPAW
jgi:hypothetical protein